MLFEPVGSLELLLTGSSDSKKSKWSALNVIAEKFAEPQSKFFFNYYFTSGIALLYILDVVADANAIVKSAAAVAVTVVVICIPPSLFSLPVHFVQPCPMALPVDFSKDCDRKRANLQTSHPACISCRTGRL